MSHDKLINFKQILFILT